MPTRSDGDVKTTQPHCFAERLAARSPRMSSVAAVALVVSAVACGEVPEVIGQTCTLIGCASGLTFTMPWAESAASFDVDVDGPTLVGSFTCAKNANGFFVLAPETATGSFAATTAVECQGPGFTIGETPDALVVTVAAGQDTRRRGFSRIQYLTSQPNGPDCEPTCSQLTLTLE